MALAGPCLVENSRKKPVIWLKSFERIKITASVKGGSRWSPPNPAAAASSNQWIDLDCNECNGDKSSVDGFATAAYGIRKWNFLAIAKRRRVTARLASERSANWRRPDRCCRASGWGSFWARGESCASPVNKSIILTVSDIDHASFNCHPYWCDLMCSSPRGNT